jgi:cell division protein FtsI/penicillin-binding protein 2
MLGVTLWSLFILARLVQLQVVQHDKYTQKAYKNQQNTQSVPAPRGIIYDSQMDVLATNAPVKTVVVEPIRIDNKSEVARKLAAILKIDSKDLLDRMSNPKKKWYLRVQRRINPALETRIKSLGIEGLRFEK